MSEDKNPFQSGDDNSADKAALDDFDPSAAKPSWQVLVPGVLLLVAGAMTATAGFQAAVFIRFYSPVATTIPWILVLCGISLVVLCAFLSRGRAWASWVASGLIALTTLIALCWNIYLILVGVVSPVNWLCLLLDALCVIVVPLSIPEARRITAIRKRMYEDP